MKIQCDKCYKCYSEDLIIRDVEMEKESLFLLCNNPSIPKSNFLLDGVSSILEGGKRIRRKSLNSIGNIPIC